mmetsp:Transcript_35479/g.56878  ORF Transcript_35479/g.56878 Transcript_35479/m.56878 type:complete len:219 (-) Transcript_35479:35-691(-)
MLVFRIRPQHRGNVVFSHIVAAAVCLTEHVLVWKDDISARHTRHFVAFGTEIRAIIGPQIAVAKLASVAIPVGVIRSVLQQIARIIAFIAQFAHIKVCVINLVIDARLAVKVRFSVFVLVVSPNKPEQRNEEQTANHNGCHAQTGKGRGIRRRSRRVIQRNSQQTKPQNNAFNLPQSTRTATTNYGKYLQKTSSRQKQTKHQRSNGELVRFPRHKQRE